MNGNYKMISASYDEVSEDGKIIGTNNRISRIITDEDVIAHYDAINNYVNSIIQEG
jgi:hypothetical protein